MIRKLNSGQAISGISVKAAYYRKIRIEFYDNISEEILRRIFIASEVLND